MQKIKSRSIEKTAPKVGPVPERGSRQISEPQGRAYFPVGVEKSHHAMKSPKH